MMVYSNKRLLIWLTLLLSARCILIGLFYGLSFAAGSTATDKAGLRTAEKGHGAASKQRDVYGGRRSSERTRRPFTGSCPMCLVSLTWFAVRREGAVVYAGSVDVDTRYGATRTACRRSSPPAHWHTRSTRRVSSLFESQYQYSPPHIPS